MATKRTKPRKKAVPDKKIEGTRDVKLKMVLPPDLPTLYVDNVNVVHTPSEFTISFMQARPPLFAEQAEIDNVESVESRCVARLVISPMRLQSIIQTLAANFQKYVATNLQPQETDRGDNSPKTDDGTTSA